jgi:hypothetical protein
MLMNPNQETWASPEVYKTYLVAGCSTSSRMFDKSKPKFSLYTPTKEEPDLHEDTA